MRRNQAGDRILALTAMALLAVLPAKQAMADSGSAPLLARLTRVYRLASPAIETDGSPAFVRRTLLLVQQTGVVGYDHANIALEEICPARLEADQLIPPRSVLCSAPVSQSRKVFPVADRVCVTAFRLSEATDRLSIYLIECGAGARIRTDQTFYAMIDVQLPKGSLETGSLAAVQSEIAKILVPEGSTAPRQADEAKSETVSASGPEPVHEAPPLPAPAPASQPASTPPSPAEQERMPPPLPPLSASAPSASDQGTDQKTDTATDTAAIPAANALPDQAAQPRTVALGQTVDQVAAILGAPSIAGIAGGKLIFIYPQRFRIVFLNGKVIEIDPLKNS